MTSAAQLLFLTSGLVLLAGCVSTAPAILEPHQDLARRERLLGDILFPSLAARLPKAPDLDLEVYLRHTLESLALASPELKDSPVGVYIYRDPDGLLSSYTLPGLRVFLSAQMLKALKYESELAGLLAYELSLVEKGILLSRMSAVLGGPVTPEDLREKLPNAPDWRGNAGFYAFSRADRVDALKRAVSVLYDSGFDPRGVLAMIDAWRSAGKKSPWPNEDLSAVREEIRTELNTFPPLRNPVVRSEEFVKMLKRIERL